jgi:O-antigen/teichoic acid export membrane protein
VTIFHKGGLLRNTGWMFIGQISAYALRVVYFVIIARLLGVAQYGIFAGAFALVNIVAQYSRLGSGMVLLRYVSADHSRFAAYWANVLVIIGGLTGLLLLVLHVTAPHLIGPASASIVMATAIGTCFCEQLTYSVTQVFQANEDMPMTAMLNLATSLARTVAAGLLFFTVHRASAQQWAMWSMLASLSVTVIALVLVTVRFGWPRFALALLKQRWREGLQYAFASSTTTVYDDVDKAMLSHYGMNAAAGIYAMAYRIIEMATMPISSMQLAAEPRLFKLAATGLRETMDLGRRLLSKGVLASICISAALFLVAPVIPYIVGNSFGEGVLALRWLCLIPLFRSVHYITGSTLTCSGFQRFRTLNQIAAASLNFGVNLYLIPRYGWHGAAWSSLLTDASLGLMNWAVLMMVVQRDSLRLAERLFNQT